VQEIALSDLGEKLKVIQRGLVSDVGFGLLAELRLIQEVVDGVIT
jgi:hypothetical protein